MVRLYNFRVLILPPTIVEYMSTSLIATLKSYIPDILQQRIVNDPTPPNKPFEEKYMAAVLFVDISGFTALTENPGEYIGKEISVEGKVVHVCMQSGKKLFITGKDPDISLYIQAGEEMPKFPTELLGSEVEVQGILTKLESGAEQPGKEGMHSAEGEIMASANTDSCPTEKALAGQAVLSDLMMVYNKHMVIN